MTHPFLSQLIASCDDFLHRVVHDDSGVSLSRSDSVESLPTAKARKRGIGNIFKSVRNRLSRNSSRKDVEVKLKASNIHLDRFGIVDEHLDGSGSESSDFENEEENATGMNFKLSNSLKFGRLDFGALMHSKNEKPDKERFPFLYSQF